MNRFRSFVSLTLLGGLTVVLPIALLALIFGWLFGLLDGLLAPFVELITREAEVSGLLAKFLALVGILGVCFVIGLLIKTRLGRWLHGMLDRWLVKLAPGYKTIREVVSQFLGGSGNESLLRGQPALAKLFGSSSPVAVTAIITSRHGDGGYTVFVPTAPIPTSGVTYHLPADCVEILQDVSVEEAMRTIIACGSGSAEMLAKRQGGNAV